MAAWTYLLVCAEGLTYLGATTNLKRRLHAHWGTLTFSDTPVW
ncbi:GIY-YIG nuclease family protein [Pseudoduganella chitinolytica]